MKLLFYHEEQDALRVYDTEWECWEDMISIYVDQMHMGRATSLARLISYGWELVGEI